MNPVTKLFYVALFVTPYYVLPGGLQPSIVVLLTMLGLLLVTRGARLPVTSSIARQLVLTAHVFLVNASWFIVTGEESFLLYIAIAGFTSVAFVAVATVARDMDERDARRMLQVVLATLLTQLLILGLGYGRPSYRTLVYFNNPNQLGYFCVLCATLAVVTGHLYRIASLLVPAIVIAATVLASFSLSKAGIVGCLMNALIMLFFTRSLSAVRKLLVVAIVAVVLAATADGIRHTELYEHLDRRVNGFQPDNDDSLSHRGYTRILDYPEYIVLGAGEGLIERFDSLIELHSYPGTVLFSYGLIGVALTLYFLKAALGSWTVLFYLSPVWFYNLTHHGGRTVFFWILLGVIAARVERERSAATFPPKRQAGHREKAEALWLHRHSHGASEASSRVPHSREDI